MKSKNGKWIVVDKKNHVIGVGNTLHDARKDLLCKMTVLRIIEQEKPLCIHT